MSLPVVAIVGRPNVGKSSLLNRLVGRRIAIVDPTPGVTRDRVSSPLALTEPTDDSPGRYVDVVDTGGMGNEDVDRLTDEIEAQIAFAIASAALILFVVDAREGVATLDRRVAETLRRQDKKVILVANKCDDPNQVTQIHEMTSLGFGEPLPVSANHGLGFPELVDRLAEQIGEAADEMPEPVMKLAVVGKRNAGKSTFINALAGEKRVIVSETPGTTRDSVDVTFQLDGRTFMVIDTAGVRKQRRIADGGLEFFSHHRAMRSVRRADVVALMIDASEPISQVDKLLAGEIAEQFKPVVMVVNKWDLARDKTDCDAYGEYLVKMFPELAFAPVSLTSAAEGNNVFETVRLAEELFQQAQTRISTSHINQAIQKILELRGPSHKSGTKVPHILYASQISTCPPTIVCFVNDVRSFDVSYQRFLMNRLRELLPFEEVPIRLVLRQRRSGRE